VTRKIRQLEVEDGHVHKCPIYVAADASAVSHCTSALYHCV